MIDTDNPIQDKTDTNGNNIPEEGWFFYDGALCKAKCYKLETTPYGKSTKKEY
jgi:hypothetical protein|tara:strand:+ start:2523 stop:2681 length:159 start_codon:yes stop_codon:yes gene_type:complete